jgi:hypothetical protein
MFSFVKNNFLKLVSAVVLSSVGILSSGSAIAADQCIKNNSATVIRVNWYELNTTNKVKSESLTVGEKSCKSALGIAEIECVGCAWGEASAKAGLILGGGIAYGTCVAVTGGACILGAEVIAGLVEYGYDEIPAAFKGKLVVAPKKTQNISVEGTAFGLKLK